MLRNTNKEEGSIWFRRFRKEVEAMSPHFKFIPIKFGYYRIYWTGGGEPAYVHEIWKWMPLYGYEIEEKDINLVSKKYFEEYEDQLEMNRLLKNFVEGYHEAIDTMRSRRWMFKNNKEFRQKAVDGYRQMMVK